jgi:hypothetical protein
MLVRLPAEFVRGQVILFAVGDGRSRMCVGGKVMQFGGSLVWSL